MNIIFHKLQILNNLRLKHVLCDLLKANYNSTHTLSLESYHNSGTAFEVIGTHADSGGGNVRVAIAKGGQKVGIGTDNPSQELTVYGDDPIISIQEASASSQVDIGTGTVTGFINIQKADGTRTIQISGNGDSYLTGGVFGVGTNSPSSIIHATGSNSGTGYYFNNTHTTSGFGMRVQGGGSTADRYSLAVFEAQGTERFRVNANGKVGINSAIPEFEITLLNPEEFKLKTSI